VKKPIALMPLMAAAVLAALPLAAAAQTKMTPGLWEQQAKMGAGNPQMEAAMAKMQQQLAAMPPERRKQMEEMMAKQGVSMPGGAGAGGMAVKYCLSPERAARDEVMQPESNCKQTSMSRSGNTVKFTVECTAPRPGKGEGEMTFISPKEHKGRIKFTSTREGREQSMEIEHHAKWLAADCGDIKPR
jgi:Protein of unknown function (DUF3617)